MRLLRSADLAFVSDEALNAYDYISGHIGFGICQRLNARFFRFAFLRDPVARTLSHYYYWRHFPHPERGPGYRLARELSLEEFLRAPGAPRFQFANMQTWMLYESYEAFSREKHKQVSPETLLEVAKANVDTLDFVGIQEAFSEGLEVLAGLLGCSGTYDARLVNATADRPDVTELSRSEREAVDEATALDRALYEHCRQRWLSWAPAVSQPPRE